jgi:hypothetical protein
MEHCQDKTMVDAKTTFVDLPHPDVAMILDGSGMAATPEGAKARTSTRSHF